MWESTLLSVTALGLLSITRLKLRALTRAEVDVLALLLLFIAAIKINYIFIPSNKILKYTLLLANLDYYFFFLLSIS